MRFLTLDEVLQLHTRIIEQSGGMKGILDINLLESALVSCRMSFAGHEWMNQYMIVTDWLESYRKISSV